MTLIAEVSTEPRWARLVPILTTARRKQWPERIAWGGVPPLVRGVAKTVWRLEVEFGDGFPDPPFVVAGNHHSFLDPFLIGGIFGQKIRFLALQDLFGNHRWLDFALEAFDVIPIRRGVTPLGAMRGALDHLDRGGVLGLFPEGTRHPVFDAQRARHGAAWLATHAGVPLVPVALSGTQRVLGVDNRLHIGRICIVVGPAMHGNGDGRPAIHDLTHRWGRWVADSLDAP